MDRTNAAGGHEMEHKIVGTTMPVLEVTLDPGESVVAEGAQRR